MQLNLINNEIDRCESLDSGWRNAGDDGHVVEMFSVCSISTIWR
jgi:hypothetical protein